MKKLSIAIALAALLAASVVMGFYKMRHSPMGFNLPLFGHMGQGISGIPGFNPAKGLNRTTSVPYFTGPVGPLQPEQVFCGSTQTVTFPQFDDVIKKEQR